jgi:hypothetical protein
VRVGGLSGNSRMLIDGSDHKVPPDAIIDIEHLRPISLKFALVLWLKRMTGMHSEL